jgi:hypothetical protein
MSLFVLQFSLRGGTMLGLRQLRQEVYASWVRLKGLQTGVTTASRVADNSDDEDRLPYVDDDFKDEIRRSFGDLRCRQTWENAAITLTARRIAEFDLAPHEIVGYLASSQYRQCTIRQHYGEQLIEAVLKFPEILEVLQDGLEHLYHVSTCAADREIAQRFVKKVTYRLWPARTPNLTASPAMAN